MREDDARNFLLVRAVETEDSGETLLSREDRRYASAAALAAAPLGAAAARPDPLTGSEEDFLARRAAVAYNLLAERYRSVERVCRSARWPGWVDWALPLGALAIGVATNEISGNRLNIIAFPLLGMLAWNLLVYALLLIRPLRRLVSAGRGGTHPLAAALRRLTNLERSPVEWQPPLGDGLARFARDWLHFSSPLSGSRARRALHLSAALLAVGVLLGMYGRAIGIEYRAGWESTWFGDPRAVTRLLEVVLGPASALTGIALPGPERMEALRWSNGGGGENAGPWIHLYATTAFLFIVGPRLLLASGHAARVRHLRRHFPIPGGNDSYLRRLLRDARGAGSSVRVVPYSFHPPQESQATLRRLFGDTLGEATQVTIDPPIPYGEEDAWLAGDRADGDHDHLVILLNLSATPEAENHGALVAGLRRHQAANGGGPALTVLLDETAYRQRLAGQGGAEGRIETRRLAWEKVMTQQGIKPVSLDLQSTDKVALAQSLDTALLQAQARAQGAGPA